MEDYCYVWPIATFLSFFINCLLITTLCYKKQYISQPPDDEPYFIPYTRATLL